MQTETKHTPGPWHANTPVYESHAGGSTIREAQWGDIIATVSATRDEGGYSTIANAHLIAAAPDLLAACKGLVGAVARDDHDSRIDGALDSARAAIAKAEGGAA